MVGQIVADSGLQLTHAAECPSPDASVGKQTKEAFDLVQPTGAGGSEVHMVAGAARKPALYFGHLVSAIVIHHQVDVEWFGNRFVDSFQETQQLLMSVTAVAGANHFTRRYIESSKQRRGSVADVIVSFGARAHQAVTAVQDVCDRVPGLGFSRPHTAPEHAPAGSGRDPRWPDT